MRCELCARTCLGSEAARGQGAGEPAEDDALAAMRLAYFTLRPLLFSRNFLIAE